MNKTKNCDKIKAFYDELIENAGYKSDSFLMEWFNLKITDMIKLPDAVDRSGISKGDSLPVPKGKQLLALHEFAFPALPLKRFSDLYGLNYGTVRNWRNTDEIFPQVVSRYASEFIQQWVSEFMSCAESSNPEGFAKAIRMARESKIYRTDYLADLPHATLKALEAKLKQLKTPSKDIPDILEQSRISGQHRLLNRLIASYCEGGGQLPDFLYSLFCEDAAMLASNFKTLAELIADEKASSILKLAETQVNSSLASWYLISRELID